ncbi:MAG: hypothetical protein ACPG4S_06205, partial [Schleiferiaceae bacterium]
QWKAKQKSVPAEVLRAYMMPREAVLIGPGRKGQEKCAILIEGGRILGYSYFYLATDSTQRAQLKMRMVDLEHNAYNVGVIQHYLSKGYLQVLED